MMDNHHRTMRRAILSLRFDNPRGRHREVGGTSLGQCHVPETDETSAARKGQRAG